MLLTESFECMNIVKKLTISNPVHVQIIPALFGSLDQIYCDMDSSSSPDGKILQVKILVSISHLAFLRGYIITFS